MDSVTRQQIVAQIAVMGVRGGDLLVAHSALSSFGHVDGGADAVASALVEVVSPGGSAFVPTFNYGELPYDAQHTRSLTGAITEAFRHLPGAVRSAHPTHSWCGAGPAAAQVLEGHDVAHAFGDGSPLWRLWQRNAWVLLIGCDHRSNSMIHVAEELLGLPFVFRQREAQWLRPHGIERAMVRRPGCSESFNRIDPVLRARRAVVDATVGRSKMMLMRSADVVDAAVSVLRDDPAALLCPTGACQTCDEARRMLKEPPSC